MHRSIVGIADAYQSIADGKAALRKKKGGESLKRFAAEMEAVQQDVASNQRLNDASQYFGEMQNCTSRIASKLREIDSIDLNAKTDYESDDADPVSNQKRFIDDQCVRAQALLTGEYYLRNLHTQEVNTAMVDLDERITYTAKNWKHQLVEIGVSEAELADLQPPAVEAAHETPLQRADTRKVRRNSVITQAQPSIVAVEADYSGYNVAELSELNDILSTFMDQTFLNGANGQQLSRKWGRLLSVDVSMCTCIQLLWARLPFGIDNYLLADHITSNDVSHSAI
jgi:DNA repair ATPase RecN